MTKAQTKINYAKAINKVALYVDQHFDAKLTLPDLAKIADISPFHFAHIMQSCTGETPGEFLQRCRLRHAYKQLQANSKRDILDLALSVGYENHSSFTRAFRKHFGLSPTAILQGQKPTQQAAHMNQGTSSKHLPMDPEFIELDQFCCYGIETQGYAKRRFIEAAQPAFEKILATLGQHGINMRGKKLMGIPLDTPKLVDHELCRFIAAIKSSDELTQLDLTPFPFEAGQWARFNHIGPYDTLWQTWNKIYLHWVIRLGIELRDAPPFEMYEHMPHTPEDQRLTQIYIPIANNHLAAENDLIQHD